MFARNEADIIQSLGRMHDEAHNRANANKHKAKELMVEYMQADRRLDAYDHGRLADQVMQSGYNGARLDLSDPGLKRGGQARDNWKQPGGYGYR
jgi:hypothetical protein